MKIPQYNKDKWIPVSEDVCIPVPANKIIEFDKRFPIDRTFELHTFFYKYRIRFVQHPDCEKENVRFFVFRMFNMPKCYWRHVERTMKLPFFHNWLLSSDEKMMTISQVYFELGYDLNKPHEWE